MTLIVVLFSLIILCTPITDRPADEPGAREGDEPRQPDVPQIKATHWSPLRAVFPARAGVEL
jgi:hypothetical protein